MGAPDYHTMVRPYDITTDSKGRIIIRDPGAHGVHIFDFGKQKYKFISRWDTGKNQMVGPSPMRGRGCTGQHIRNRFRFR